MWKARALHRNCWKRKDDNDSKSTRSRDEHKSNDYSKGKARCKDIADQKWCSVHKTTSHSDEECFKQEKPRPPQSGRAHIASAEIGATTRPANDNEKTSLNFDYDFDEGFAFTILFLNSW